MNRKIDQCEKIRDFRRRWTLAMLLLIISVVPQKRATGQEYNRGDYRDYFWLLGELSLGNQDFLFKTADIKRHRLLMEEGLKLDLLGYIWRPQLALFNTGGQLLFLERLAGDDWPFQTSYGYNIFTTFFPNTWYPVQLYAQQNILGLSTETILESEFTTSVYGGRLTVSPQNMPGFLMAAEQKEIVSRFIEKDESPLAELWRRQNYNGREQSAQAEIFYNSPKAQISGGYYIENRRDLTNNYWYLLNKGVLQNNLKLGENTRLSVEGSGSRQEVGVENALPTNRIEDYLSDVGIYHTSNGWQLTTNYDFSIAKDFIATTIFHNARLGSSWQVLPWFQPQSGVEYLQYHTVTQTSDRLVTSESGLLGAMASYAYSVVGGSLSAVGRGGTSQVSDGKDGAIWGYSSSANITLSYPMFFQTSYQGSISQQRDNSDAGDEIDNYYLAWLWHGQPEWYIAYYGGTRYSKINQLDPRHRIYNEIIDNFTADAYITYSPLRTLSFPIGGGYLTYSSTLSNYNGKGYFFDGGFNVRAYRNLEWSAIARYTNTFLTVRPTEVEPGAAELPPILRTPPLVDEQMQTGEFEQNALTVNSVLSYRIRQIILKVEYVLTITDEIGISTLQQVFFARIAREFDFNLGRL